ncbi:MAG: hypothetical protein MUO23_08855 [Anaerolineales bacterium]|nr:hypothetical protein [Anaerolineales bacterium]
MQAVPVADGLQRDGGAIGHGFQESPDGPRLTVDPVLGEKAPVLIENGELRVALAQP